jgi:hypothetical protein
VARNRARLRALFPEPIGPVLLAGSLTITGCFGWALNASHSPSCDGVIRQQARYGEFEYERLGAYDVPITSSCIDGDDRAVGPGAETYPETCGPAIDLSGKIGNPRGSHDAIRTDRTELRVMRGLMPAQSTRFMT